MQIDIIYTEIGRGHPFYLDGVLQALNQVGGIRLVRRQTSVFELSHGLSQLGWKAVRGLYRKGGSGGLIGKMYSALRGRNKYDQGSKAVSLLGRDIREFYMHDPIPLLVAHPSLVGILRGRRQVIYQHGELIAPPEAIVSGAETILVPTEETAKPFREAGYTPEQITITGLCIEPVLARRAEDLFARRLQRLQSEQPLTGAFFSSGAEPRKHLDLIVNSAASVLRGGGGAIIFARKNGALHRKVSSEPGQMLKAGIVCDIDTPIPLELPPLLLVLFTNRRDEDALTVQLFDRFDYYVGPSHERTNWGIGLGLPMLIATPCIGPFAPLNLQLLANQGVGLAIDADFASRFGDRLSALQRQGVLSAMSQAGFGKYPVDGFAAIAGFLIKRFS